MATGTFRNLVDMLEKSVSRFARNPLFGVRQASGSWDYVTYSEVGVLVDQFRGGLASLGVTTGDRVAVISNNSVGWAVGAYATYGLGACYVPMYEKQNAKDWEYIVGDSGAKVLLVANAEIAAKAASLLDDVTSLEAIVDLSAGEDTENGYGQLLAKGREAPVDAVDPSSDDLCGFIYTSGTTGNPKGVRLSHGNIISNVNAVQQIMPMGPEDRSLSFLPWAHSFGQTCELHSGISLGSSAALCDNVDKLIGYLSEVRPTVLFSVPRIFNKIYDGLNKKMAAESPVKRFLFGRALEVAVQRRNLENTRSSSLLVDVQHRVLDQLVFSKVRDRLGGNLKYAFSGGAAISREVAEFIDNVGIKVYEGYGLSETSPIATANSPTAQRIGSVGKAIPGVEIIIDRDAVGGTMGDQGEILVKGPNVMQGYHNLPEQTAAVMREDGAFRTGDIGRIDADGYVYITGRIKEQYKLLNGKYVVPAPLEEQLKLSGYINQAMVYGANQAHNVALVVPDLPALTALAKEKGLGTDVGRLLENAEIRSFYAGELAKQAQDVFKRFERIKAFKLIPEEFSTDNDMLTPTLKLKRRNVMAAYQDTIDALYT